VFPGNGTSGVVNVGGGQYNGSACRAIFMPEAYFEAFVWAMSQKVRFRASDYCALGGFLLYHSFFLIGFRPKSRWFYGDCRMADEVVFSGTRVAVVGDGVADGKLFKR
jgi:hypothetical protein